MSCLYAWLIRYWRAAVVLLCVCNALPGFAESEPVKPQSCDPALHCDPANSKQQPKAALIDRSHRYVTNGLDGVARWFDGFFGDEQRDRESASSVVRLHYDYGFYESGETQDKVRVRGKVRLPKISRRVNLVFSDEDDSAQSPASDRNLYNDDDSQSIALQMDVRDEREFKLDHRIGLRSGRELRVGSRARYLQVFAERWKGRVSEELYWQDTVGFGSRTVFDLDYIHDPIRLTRWRTQLDYTEKSLGVEWVSSLSFKHALSKHRAISYYVRSYGYTRPDYQTRGYGPGMLYRQNFIKNWLFWEIEPQYT